MKTLYSFVPLILLAAVLSSRAAEDTTQTYLAKYGDKLSGVWSSYPQEKDSLVRRQKLADLNTAMATDLKTLDTPKDQTLGKVLNNFLSNLEKARGLFRLEKMSTERSSYIGACAAAFKREIAAATDADIERPASKCFDQLMNWTDDARGRMRVIPDDAHSTVFTNLSEIFQLMLKTASKDAGDPSAVFEQQVKEIQHRYPVSSPALQKVNAPAKAMLETAAKKVLELNKKP